MATDLRDQLHTMWGSVADGWAEHAGYVDRRGAEVTAAMLDAVPVRPGDRVLVLVPRTMRADLDDVFARWRRRV